MKKRLPLLALLITGFSFSAIASDKCAAIADPGKRLACFDGATKRPTKPNGKLTKAELEKLEAQRIEAEQAAAARLEAERIAKEEAARKAFEEEEERQRIAAIEAEKAKIAEAAANEAKAKAERKAALVRRAKEKVTLRLKDPESARFADMHFATFKKNGELSVCGQVNAKNSYGGYTGFEKFAYIVDKGELLMSNSGGGLTASINALNVSLTCSRNANAYVIEDIEG
jgi:hypothetical protein